LSALHATPPDFLGEHCPAEHQKSDGQSLSSWQSPRHACSPQGSPPQDWVCRGGQAPWLSQKAARTAVPSEQEAARQDTLGPG
jgi:hypothetical protein